MSAYICITCGTQFAPSPQPPEHCPICEDARQFVGHNGQQWIAPAELAQRYYNRVERIEPGLTGIGIEPHFGIGQRALLIETPQYNVLWDCVSLLSQPAIDMLTARGGIDVIAISHPHFYTAMVDWAEALDAQILLHADDRAWVMREHKRITYWEGERHAISDSLTLVRCGGHFEGGTVLHWPAGAEGRGVLCSGDIIQVVADRDWVSFMYSYPNLIPLPAFVIARVAGAVSPLAFERLYGGWWQTVVEGEADAKVARSAERYRAALAGAFHRDTLA